MRRSFGLSITENPLHHLWPLSLRFVDQHMEHLYKTRHITRHLESKEIRAAALLGALFVLFISVLWGTNMVCHVDGCDSHGQIIFYHIMPHQNAIYFTVPCIATLVLSIGIFVFPQTLCKTDNWQVFVAAVFSTIFFWDVFYNPYVFDLLALESSTSKNLASYKAALENFTDYQNHKQLVDNMQGYRGGLYSMLWYGCFFFLSGLRWEYLGPTEIVFMVIRVNLELANKEDGLDRDDMLGTHSAIVITTLTETLIVVGLLYMSRQRDIQLRHAFLISKSLNDANLTAEIEVDPFRVSNLQRWFMGTTNTSKDSNKHTDHHADGDNHGARQSAADQLDLPHLPVTTLGSDDDGDRAQGARLSEDPAAAPVVDVNAGTLYHRSSRNGVKPSLPRPGSNRLSSFFSFVGNRASGNDSQSKVGQRGQSLGNLSLAQQQQHVEQQQKPNRSQREQQSKKGKDQQIIQSFVLDTEGLKLGSVIADGGGGRVYTGTYYGQTVAIKEVFGQVLQHPVEVTPARRSVGGGDGGGDGVSRMPSANQRGRSNVSIDLSNVAHEIQFMSRLHSPFIVRFYGISLSKTGNSLLIVEELCECSMKDLLAVGSMHRQKLKQEDKRREKDIERGEGGRRYAEEVEEEKVVKIDPRYAHLTPLTRAQWLKAALQIAKGVEYCHSLCIVHRDLKPANFLLDKHGVTKVCDFGISRIVSDSSKDRTIMTGGVGTLGYMAPELVDGKHGTASAGLAVDVYSFGMLLWAFVTGKEPWFDKGRFALIMAVLKGERPTIPRQTPRELKTLIEDCWAHQAKDRPVFKEVVARLSEMQKSEALLSKLKELCA